MTSGHDSALTGISRPCPLPSPLSHLGRGFVERELVRPGREATIATEVAQLAQDRDERVVGALVSEIVIVAAAQMRSARASAVYLKARRSQQQRVQLDERRVVLSARGAEPLDPRLGVPGNAPGGQ